MSPSENAWLIKQIRHARAIDKDLLDLLKKRDHLDAEVLDALAERIHNGANIVPWELPPFITKFRATSVFDAVKSQLKTGYGTELADLYGNGFGSSEEESFIATTLDRIGLELRAERTNLVEALKLRGSSSSLPYLLALEHDLAAAAGVKSLVAGSTPEVFGFDQATVRLGANAHKELLGLVREAIRAIENRVSFEPESRAQQSRHQDETVIPEQQDASAVSITPVTPGLRNAGRIAHHLIAARQLQSVDAGSVLTKCRMIAEAICKDLLHITTGIRSGKEANRPSDSFSDSTLEDMISTINRRRRLPPHVEPWLRSLQYAGNIGAHDQTTNPDQPNLKYSAPFLDMANHLIEWYCSDLDTGWINTPPNLPPGNPCEEAT
ncbi:DUF4145 domain-containing protein [Ramlibacter sp. MAHUQ-53]|uniref:DUF4145 domain-containing protein n=1 Tax=unclassified Ramlibacter TaxID=2617605 RepID=UPI00363E9014